MSAALALSGVALGVCVALFDAYKVPTASMEPTIKTGDRLLVRTGGFGGAERGDIVIYHGPAGELPDARVSRVVAVGGERVEGRRGKVLVNGSALDENYLPDGETTSDFDVSTVPQDAVFLISDNRHNARDSRTIGPISRDRLIGTVSFINRPIDLGLMVLCAALLLVLLALGARRARR